MANKVVKEVKQKVVKAKRAPVKRTSKKMKEKVADFVGTAEQAICNLQAPPTEMTYDPNETADQMFQIFDTMDQIRKSYFGKLIWEESEKRFNGLITVPPPPAIPYQPKFDENGDLNPRHPGGGGSFRRRVKNNKEKIESQSLQSPLPEIKYHVDENANLSTEEGRQEARAQILKQAQEFLDFKKSQTSSEEVTTKLEIEEMDNLDRLKQAIKNIDRIIDENTEPAEPIVMVLQVEPDKK